MSKVVDREVEDSGYTNTELRPVEPVGCSGQVPEGSLTQPGSSSASRKQLAVLRRIIDKGRCV